MKSTDLRSPQIKLVIVSFMVLSVFGLSVPLISHFVDEQMVIDATGIDKSGSGGFAVIMMAVFFGIGFAFIQKRRATFRYYKEAVCKTTGEKCYENDRQDKLFCTTHGEQDHNIFSDHFTEGKLNE